MASPAQLVETVSRVTGIPLPTIVDIDRRLVTGNLRAKGGRGLHAARMTALDAARLLTAVLAGPQANASVDAVDRYARTQADTARSSDTLYRATELGELTSLPAAHGFVDALAALIGSASSGALAELILKSGDGWVPRIEVFAFTRATRGRIRLSGLLNGATAGVEYIPPSPVPRSARGKRPAVRNTPLTDENLGDLEQSRRVTERTILPIATLLAEGRDD